jgi:hypothetical protein
LGERGVRNAEVEGSIPFVSIPFQHRHAVVAEYRQAQSFAARQTFP